MDDSAYRKRMVERVAAAPEPTEQADRTTAVDVLRERGQPIGRRLAAVPTVADLAGSDTKLIDRLIALVADLSEPSALRVAAIDALQGLAFLVIPFAPKRPAYLEALRANVDDPDPTLRRRALAILARGGDEFAQRRLVEGLEHPSKALVPAAKAIQYLGYDVHGEYFPILRRIAEKPPTATARREAIRLLAADPNAKTLLRRILHDKAEPTKARHVSAMALQALAPETFQRSARRISLDETDDDKLRATTLGALARSKEPGGGAGERTFSRRVASVHDAAKSPALRRASKSYLDR